MRSTVQTLAVSHHSQLNRYEGTLELLFQCLVTILEERDELIVFLLIELEAIILG